MSKIRYECIKEFEVTADLKPYHGPDGKPRDVKWIEYKVGASVPEKVVKASPSLLGTPDREACVRKVEG